MCLCRGQPRGLTASHRVTPTPSAFSISGRTYDPTACLTPRARWEHRFILPKCLHSIEFHSTAAISPALGPNQRETKGMFVGEEEERSSLALPRGPPPPLILELSRDEPAALSSADCSAARAVLGHRVSPWLFGEAPVINWPPTVQTSAAFHCSSTGAGSLGGARRHYLCKQDGQTFTQDKHLKAPRSPGGRGVGSTRLNAHLVAAFTRRVRSTAKRIQANKRRSRRTGLN